MVMRWNDGNRGAGVRGFCVHNPDMLHLRIVTLPPIRSWASLMRRERLSLSGSSCLLAGGFGIINALSDFPRLERRRA